MFAFCAQSPRCIGLFPFLWNSVGRPLDDACCMGVKDGMPEVLLPALEKMGAAIKGGAVAELMKEPEFAKAAAVVSDPSFGKEPPRAADAMPSRMKTDEPAAERIFPDDPNHDAAGKALPIQQNNCKDKPYPNDQMEQGQVFQVTVPGYVTAARLVSASEERGLHTARIWRVHDKKKLAESDVPASEFNGTSRWLQVPIGPVKLDANIQYMVTATTGTDQWHAWAGCPTCWSPAGSNGRHISWPANSARFSLGGIGSMPQVVPQYGESYLKDVVFCANASTCAPLPPPPPPPYLSEIVLAGPRFIERPAGDRTRSRGRYRAELIDQFGKRFKQTSLSWSVPGAPSAVSIGAHRPSALYPTHTADLEVEASLGADTVINVSATIGGVSASLQVHVALLEPTTVAITGPAAVNLDVTSSQRHVFTASVVDQLGQAVTAGAGSIDWKLSSAEQIDPTIKPKMTKPPPNGVSIDPKTGVLTVVPSGDRGDFTVQASLLGGGGVHGAVFVAGDAFNASAFLKTNATAVTLTVGGALPGGLLRMRSLRHITAAWEWICDDGVVVPLPLPRGGSALAWAFKDAAQNETVATFRFAAGDLELESTWVARDGGGPVENRVQITNRGAAPAVFTSSLQSASTKLMTPPASVFSMHEKRGVGTPLEPMNIVLRPGLNMSVATGGPGRHAEVEGQYIPLAFIHAQGSRYSGTAHGIYIGSEWELGHFHLSSRGGANFLDTILTIKPIEPADSAKNLLDDFVTIATGTDPDIHAVMSVPTVYYGAYQGSGADSGPNSFKAWYWEHKITRSLHAHANEPWTEICWAPLSGALFPGGRPAGWQNISGYGDIPQSLYNATAATGVESLKIDCCVYNDTENRDWTFRRRDWPHGFTYSQQAHLAGLHTSLYLGGTYRDANLSTVAGRDAELAAVRSRYDAGWMDMWRTDTYDAPEQPVPNSFAGVVNFLSLMDEMIATRPGFRYEDCGNGGHFKGLALARRFTFVTTNDNAPNVTNYRQTHWVNSHVLHPLQLKCDLAFWTPSHNLDFMLRSCLLGSFMVCPPSFLNISENPAYAEHVQLYKTKQRPIMRGGSQYHILPFPDGENLDGMQYHNERLGEGSVVLFKPGATAPPNATIPLQGLKRRSQYRLDFQDRTQLSKVVSGAELMDEGLVITGLVGAEASEIIFVHEVRAHGTLRVKTEDTHVRHRRLRCPEGSDDCTEIVQSALDDPARQPVVLPARAGGWPVAPLYIRRDRTHLILEPSCSLRARNGSYCESRQ